MNSENILRDQSIHSTTRAKAARSLYRTDKQAFRAVEDLVAELVFKDDVDRELMLEFLEGVGRDRFEYHRSRFFKNHVTWDTDDSMSELLPCPNCGALASINVGFYSGDPKRSIERPISTIRLRCNAPCSLDQGSGNYLYMDPGRESRQSDFLYPIEEALKYLRAHNSALASHTSLLASLHGTAQELDRCETKNEDANVNEPRHDAPDSDRLPGIIQRAVTTQPDHTPSPVDDDFLAAWRLVVQAIKAKAGNKLPGTKRKSLLDQWAKVQCGLLDNELRLFELHQVEREWSDTDLILQLSGPLFGLPTSFVQFGNAPLYRQVASITRSVSLQLLGHDIENLKARPSDSEPRRDVLTAFWIDPALRSKAGTPLFMGIPRLLDKLQRLVSTTTMKWRIWALGDTPRATIGNVSSVLLESDKQFGIVFIAGHGRRTAGIELADGHWQGEGIDLGKVQLVILNCCWVGRLDETSDGSGDIEGFYAQIVLLSKLFLLLQPGWW